MRCLSVATVAWIACALQLAVPAAASSSGSEVCDADSGPVTCTSCAAAGSPGAARVLSRLPRINRHFELVSDNLGDYAFFTCPGTPSVAHTGANATACTVNPLISSIVDNAAGAATTALKAAAIHGPINTADPQTYVESILAYTLVGILFMMLSILTALLFCTCRSCCCCSWDSGWCCCARGGGCGKRHPTFAVSVCRLGFTDVASSTTSMELAYPLRSRVGVRLLMFGYAVLVVAMVLVGQFWGNEALTQAQLSMADSPRGFMSTVRGLTTPISDALISVSADAAVPFITQLNDTVLSAVDLDASQAATTCLLTGVTTSLPDPTALLTFIDDTLFTLANVSVVGAALVADVANVSSALGTAANSTGRLALQLQALPQPLAALVGEASNLNATVLALQHSLTDLQAPDTGLRSVATDCAGAAQHLPSAADADSAATGSNSLATLLALNMEGNGGNPGRTSLRTKLVRLRTRLAAVPNVTATADKLRGISSMVRNIQSSRLLDRVAQYLANITTILAGMPAEAGLVQELGSLNSLLTSVPSLLAPLRSDLIALAALLDDEALPDFSIPQRELHKISSLRGTLDCLGVLVAQVHAVNASLLRLPSALSGVDAIYATVNASYEQVSGLVSTAAAQLDALVGPAGNSSNSNGTTPSGLLSALPNVTAILMLLDAQQQAAASPPFDIAALQTTLSSVGSVRANATASIAAALAAVTAANTSLWSPGLTPDPRALDGLAALQPRLEDMSAQIGASIDALDVYSSFLRCAGTDTVCSAAGSFAAPCDPAHVCEGAHAACTSDWTAVCFQNSDCVVAGGTCPFNGPIFLASSAALTAYSSGSGADALIAFLSTVADDCTAAATAVDAIPPLSSMVQPLNGVTAAISDVDFSAVDAALQDVVTTLQPGSLGLDQPAAALQTFTDTIAALDLAGIRSQVVRFQESLVEVNDKVALLKALASLLGGLQRLLLWGLPTRLPDFQRPRLTVVQDTQGLSGLLDHLLASTQELVDTALTSVNLTLLTDAVSGGGQGVGLPASLPFNLTDAIEPLRPYLNILTQGQYTAYGPFYFFASLAGVDTVQPEEVDAASTTASLFSQPDGSRWSGGRYCLLSNCVRNTITQYNQQPLGPVFQRSALPALQDSALPHTFPLSRETLFFLPFLIPLAIAAVGACGALFCCGHKWQRVPACVSAACICTLLPVVFVVAGAVLFPMALLLNDGCRGGLNLAYNYVQGSEAWICQSLPNAVYVPAGAIGEGTIAHCALDLAAQQGALPASLFTFLPLDSLPSNASTIRIAVSELYLAVFGQQQCASHGAALTSLFADVAAVATQLPPAAVNATLHSWMDAQSTVQLQPPLWVVLNSFGTAVGSAAGVFVGGVSQTLSCDALSADVAAVVTSVCCDFNAALYWFISSWYVIALAACICGFPASIWGYKRFPSKLWGPDYRDRLHTHPLLQGQSSVRIDDWQSSSAAGRKRKPRTMNSAKPVAGDGLETAADAAVWSSPSAQQQHTSRGSGGGAGSRSSSNSRSGGSRNGHHSRHATGTGRSVSAAAGAGAGAGIELASGPYPYLGPPAPAAYLDPYAYPYPGPTPLPPPLPPLAPAVRRASLSHGAPGSVTAAPSRFADHA